jgi:hypothetical protein
MRDWMGTRIKGEQSRGSARRSVVGFIAGAAIVVGVVGASLWRRPATIAVRREVVDLGMILPMVAVTVPVEVRNAHPLRQATIKEVSSGCPCTIVDDGPHVIGPLGTKHLKVVVRPGRHDRIIETQVFLTQDDDYTVRFIVRGKVASPFEGWPDRARVTSAGGALVLDVRPEFLDLIADAACHVAGRSEPIRVVVDREQRRLVAVNDREIPTDGTAELVLTLLAPEPVVWSGWIVGSGTNGERK